MKSVCTTCYRFESQQVALRQRHTTVIDSSHTWMHQGTWAKLRNELVENGKGGEVTMQKKKRKSSRKIAKVRKREEKDRERREDRERKYAKNE
ncbi:hypothetical protein QVD17_25451 [Tagetes erecta]|uniref:Uncharacterized protein n=1 Tax=Tagetes erecta TaxID=13708 RepID=A0AAD8NVG8_TARER|nr:hypothetical protein QVD17_25451 [Tagetes erecta]